MDRHCMICDKVAICKYFAAVDAMPLGTCFKTDTRAEVVKVIARDCPKYKGPEDD